MASHNGLDKVEIWLRGHMKGSSLLCEAPFKEEHCATTSALFAKLLRDQGLDPGRRYFVEHWPLVYAVWLSNEAFFNYQSGAYWPFVLGKISVDNPNAYSSKFGRDFVTVLDRFHLPRFKRLTTQWSYLGPILAHSGIPRSCLPEFFEDVLPRVVERGMTSHEEFQAFQEELPSLKLSRAVEWFVRFGDAVAEDFVWRCAALYRAKLGGDAVAATGDRLPERVTKAFHEWWGKSGDRRRSAPSSRFRKPTLTFDPWQGIRLLLPSQPCSSGELEWSVHTDSIAPQSFVVGRLPGESTSEAREVMLAAPFASVIVRLMQGTRELGFWPFAGLSQQYPVLFFDPAGSRVVPRSSLDASDLGVLHPSGTRVIGYDGDDAVEPRRITNIGELRLGWSGLTAGVFDFSNCDSIGILEQNGESLTRIELREVDVHAPRLVGGDQAASTRDGIAVYEGVAPSVEIGLSPSETLQDALAAWSIRIIGASGQSEVVPARQLPLNDPNLVVDCAHQKLRVDLSQPALLGTRPYGIFELSMLGPIGRDAQFNFIVQPRIAQSMDWADWKPSQPTTLTLKVPSGVRLIGAETTSDPKIYRLRTPEDRVRLSVVVTGFAGHEWTIPYDVRIAFPSWALFEREKAALLLTWSREVLKTSISELEGHAPTLLLRLGTPWGIPNSGVLSLRSGTGEVLRHPLVIDSQGFSSADLSAIIAAARQHQAARLELHVITALQTRELVIKVLTLEREWHPKSLEIQHSEDTIALDWEERFPIDGRAIQVLDLLAPWTPPLLMRIPMNQVGRFVAPRRALMPAPGVYRVSLGIDDEWTGAFRSLASTDVTEGVAAEWQSRCGEPATNPEGVLHRLLVDHYSGVASTPDAVVAEEINDAHFAEKILQARVSLGFGDERDRLSQKLSRLLWSILLEHVLRAVAAQEKSITPRMLMQLGFFIRPTKLGASPGDQEAEALWRIWPALGAWTDLRALRAGDRAVEDRLVRILGDGPLRDLCPLAPASHVRVFGPLSAEPIKGRVLEVKADPQTTAFAVRRMESPTALTVRFDSPPEFKVDRVVLAQMPDNRWTIQAAEDSELPVALSAIEAEPHAFNVVAFYPRQPPGCGQAPEPQIVALVKHGMAQTLRELKALCSPLPAGPIGGDAFQVAAFDWAERAASNPSVRNQLSNLTTTVALPLAREALRDYGTPGAPANDGAVRITAELQARLPPAQDDEPLSAVHLLSWLTAMALVYRGFNWPLPFLWQDSSILETGLTLQELAPRLLEHDITKICAIQALVSARERTHSADEIDAQSTGASEVTASAT